MPAKAEPRPTPESLPYWQAAESGELRLPWCATTGRCFFPPRQYSPFVAGGAVDWVTASGRARLYSYVISHRAAPGFEDEVPYVLAVVELAEGPRMMTNIVDVDPTPESLELDMPLVVRFRQQGERVVPVFAPEAAS